MVRRTVAIIQGARYGPGRLFVFACFSSVFFVLFGASTLYVAVGTWGMAAVGLVAAYAGIVVVAAVAVVPHVARVCKLERRDDGAIYFRLPAVIPVASLVLFLARAAIEVALFGVAAFSSFTLPTSLPVDSLLVVIGFDLMYGVSIGLLFGRALGVRQAVARLVASPLPSKPLQGGS